MTGVQTCALPIFGALLGMDPATAAALAIARRLRDLLIFLPGLAAWAWAERRGADGTPPVRQPAT